MKTGFNSLYPEISDDIMLTRIFNYYWDLIVNQRRWFFAIAIIFLFGVISGILIRVITPNFLDTFRDIVKDIVGDTLTFDASLMIRIFVNNITAAFVMMFGGIVLGLIPFFAILFNGFVIGYVVTASLLTASMGTLESVYLTFSTIIPHGIFEIPAILFSAALGLRFGIEWMQQNNTNTRGMIFRKNFISALACVPLLVIILFIAAGIEVFISSRFGYALISE